MRVSAARRFNMDAGLLDRIDWARPWLAPLQPIAQPILTAPDWISACNQAAAEQRLRNHRGLPIRFVPQSDLPRGMPYEAFIGETGRVPTRENLHDFFNALIWLAYPNIKARLNALQTAEIARAASSSAADAQAAGRGKVRDAATIFDENAALFVTCDSALTDALREHRWADLFVKQRAAFGTKYQVRLFGHALIEKLVAPYKAVTAHAWAVAVGEAFFSLPQQERRARIDAQIAGRLSNDMATADFMPLPVMGLPQWHAGQDEAFYADGRVFRARRCAGR